MEKERREESQRIPLCCVKKKQLPKENKKSKRKDVYIIMKKTPKKFATIFLTAVAIVFTFSTYSMAASYENDVDFSAVLPDTCGNTTFASSKKTTNRSYGQIQINSYSHCDEINCWFRTKTSTGYHYWTPYIKYVNDKKKHKVKYCDQDSSYYAKDVACDMRGENATNRFKIINDAKVKGCIWFN